MSFISAEQLATVAAVADAGSFERAGERLHISTSAVSQRIKALESAVGQAVVRRGHPSELTAAGATLLRYARQVALLDAEMRVQLAHPMAPQTVIDLPVAVNADSLATWFPAVFAQAAAWPDVRLSLSVDDEEHTADLLRDGVVLAAVSTLARPVPGCRAAPLGTMTYRPYARADLLSRWTAPDGRLDLAEVPVLRYDDKDDLQHRALRAAGVTAALPGPRIPNSQAFVAAVTAGLGWGMLPTAQIPDDADLVPVPGVAPVVRDLHWHRWKLDSPALDRLTEAVATAARAADGRAGGPGR